MKKAIRNTAITLLAEGIGSNYTIKFLRGKIDAAYTVPCLITFIGFALLIGYWSYEEP